MWFLNGIFQSYLQILDWDSKRMHMNSYVACLITCISVPLILCLRARGHPLMKKV
jgi:hypothetical protein